MSDETEERDWRAEFEKLAKDVLTNQSIYENFLVTTRNTIKALSAENAQMKRVLLEHAPQVVVIGASTGGHSALAIILRELPADFHLPIIIAQHTAPKFANPFVSWLQSATTLNVKIAIEGEYPDGGTVYIAPHNVHLFVRRDRRFGYMRHDRFRHIWIPSCDVLFHSVAKVYRHRAIGIVLTGFGADGADGLRAMYEAGAVTLAQDESSSVTYGMPKEAALLGCVRQVLALTDIPSVVCGYANYEKLNPNKEQIMNQEQKHSKIREALAALGYHVRSERGFSLLITPQTVSQPQLA